MQANANGMRGARALEAHGHLGTSKKGNHHASLRVFGRSSRLWIRMRTCADQASR